MNFTDSIQETTVGTSTAIIVVNGATSGNRTFAAAVAKGDIGLLPNTPLRVADDAGNWLTGYFTLSAPNGVYTLTRTRIAASSVGGGNVTLAGAVRKVSCVPIADQFQIGMVNPDQVVVHVVASIGQSKMCGRDAADTLVDMVNPRVLQFGCTVGNARYRTIFSGASPLHFEEGVGTSYLSPATVYAEERARTLPGNHIVLLVPLAHGGTSIVAAGVNGYTPAAWASGGALRNNAVTQTNLAIATAQTRYPGCQIVVEIISDIGESDGDNNIARATFATAYADLITYLRANITGAANATCVIGSLLPEVVASYAGYPAILGGQQDAAAALDYCKNVPDINGFRLDSWHRTSEGSRYAGRAWVRAQRDAQSSLATPVAATAVTLSGPSTGLIGTASANFTASIAGVITGTVRVTPSDGGAGGTFTPAFLDLLTGTVSGTFTYTAASSGAKTITAANNGSLTAGSVVCTIAAAASAVTLAVSASSGAQSVPVTVTVGTNNSLTGSQTEAVTLSSNVAGTFSVNPVNLSAGTPSGTSVFTPSASGVATLTGAAAGAPTLTNGTISYTVTAVDSTAPILTAPTGTQTGPTTAVGTVTTDEANGTLFALCSINAVETATTTKASANTQAITSTGVKNVSATGLTTGTLYYWHYVHRDAAGNDSGVAHSAGFTPAAAAFAAWNPADKNAAITLTNSNLTATGAATTSNNWDAQRSTVGKAAGKWYWEVTVGAGASHVIGVGVASDSLANFPGFSANGVGYYTNGTIFRSNGNVASGGPITFATGDVIGVLCDAGAGTVGFTKNGVQVSTSATYAVPAGTLFAMTASREQSATVGAATTTNFGATAFAYSPPAGFVGLA